MHDLTVSIDKQINWAIRYDFILFTVCLTCDMLGVNILVSITHHSLLLTLNNNIFLSVSV